MGTTPPAAAELPHQVTLECWSNDSMDHVDQDGFGLMRQHRTDDLPITSRMLRVDLDGSRRI
jgi:hypothetical protein